MDSVAPPPGAATLGGRTGTMAGEIPAFSFDAAALAAIAEQHAADYRDADPFPHMVFDDFLPEAVVDRLIAEFPGPGDIAWRRFDNREENKLAASKDALMGPFTRQVVAQFNSAAFVEFLQTLTGIDGLIVDPHLVGGGLHQIESGGFLEVHADFNRHPDLDVDRRLNLLLYLNRDWQDEWGGALELWDRRMKECRRRVPPVANRVAVFSTTSFSYHGHPHPLQCPPEVTRRSLAFYYYSNGRPAEEIIEADHSTLFQLRPGVARTTAPSTPDPARAWRARARRGLKQVLPPIVATWLRKLRR